MWMAHVFYGNMKAWQFAFNSDDVLAEVNVDQIVTTFPPYNPATTSLATFLVIIGSALGALGTGTGNLPTSLLGGLFSLVGSSLPSSSNTPDEASLLQTNLNSTIVNTLNTMLMVSTDVFGKGDVSSFPPALTSGNYTSAMANLFSHSRVMFPLNTTEYSLLRNGLSTRLQAGMVGQALVGGDYFWIKNSVAPQYCAEHRGIMLNGVCNTLEYPAGSCTAASFGNLDTVATQKTLDDITGYGVDLADLLTSSDQCQQETGEYYGTSSAAFDDLGVLTGSNGNSRVPPCFYNLPVFLQSPRVRLRNSRFYRLCSERVRGVPAQRLSEDKWQSACPWRDMVAPEARPGLYRSSLHLLGIPGAPGPPEVLLGILFQVE